MSTEVNSAKRTPVRRSRAPITRWHLATYVVLFALAGLAWTVSDLRMSGMDAGPGSPLGTFTFFILTWLVMMAAMMFPSAAPMVATYLGIQRGRRRKAMPTQAGATALFVTGYLITWTLLGVVAFSVIRVAGKVAVSGFSWNHGGRWLAVGVLLSAAAYETTPLKQVCLRRCRSPLSFVLCYWRDGRTGALVMGMTHGAWCVGCCWALMGALFALGVMSLAWMAVIGLLIAVEKMIPWRRAGAAAVTTLLVVLAVGVAIAPTHVPGLVVPGHGSMMGMN